MFKADTPNNSDKIITSTTNWDYIAINESVATNITNNEGLGANNNIDLDFDHTKL